MRTISVVSSKGGVGKTTLTSALAVRAAADGYRVALADLDPQGSLAGWLNRRAGEDLTIMEADSASEAVDEIDDTQTDLLFIDTPPAFINTIEDAIKAADLVVIPLRASALDILASEDAVLMAREFSKPHLCVINDAETRWKTTEAASKYLTASKVPVAKTIVTHRAAYLGAMTSGKTGPEIDKGGAARDEIAALWGEIETALKLRKGAKSRG